MKKYILNIFTFFITILLICNQQCFAQINLDKITAEDITKKSCLHVQDCYNNILYLVLDKDKDETERENAQKSFNDYFESSKSILDNDLANNREGIKEYLEFARNNVANIIINEQEKDKYITFKFENSDFLEDSKKNLYIKLQFEVKRGIKNNGKKIKEKQNKICLISISTIGGLREYKIKFLVDKDKGEPEFPLKKKEIISSDAQRTLAESVSDLDVDLRIKQGDILLEKNKFEEAYFCFGEATKGENDKKALALSKQAFCKTKLNKSDVGAYLQEYLEQKGDAFEQEYNYSLAKNYYNQALTLNKAIASSIITINKKYENVSKKLIEINKLKDDIETNASIAHENINNALRMDNTNPLLKALALIASYNNFNLGFEEFYNKYLNVLNENKSNSQIAVWLYETCRQKSKFDQSKIALNEYILRLEFYAPEWYKAKSDKAILEGVLASKSKGQELDSCNAALGYYPNNINAYIEKIKYFKINNSYNTKQQLDSCKANYNLGLSKIKNNNELQSLLHLEMANAYDKIVNNNLTSTKKQSNQDEILVQIINLYNLAIATNPNNADARLKKAEIYRKASFTINNEESLNFKKYCDTCIQALVDAQSCINKNVNKYKLKSKLEGLVICNVLKYNDAQALTLVNEADSIALKNQTDNFKAFLALLYLRNNYTEQATNLFREKKANSNQTYIQYATTLWTLKTISADMFNDDVKKKEFINLIDKLDPFYNKKRIKNDFDKMGLTAQFNRVKIDRD